MAYRAGAERPCWLTLAAVVALHGAALIGLVQAFAPDLAGRTVAEAQRLVSITLALPPPPPPAPEPAPRARPDAGSAAPPAPRASPRPVVAPSAAIVVPRVTPPALPVASDGDENRSGAANEGSGTGAGGEGQGTGGAGDGQGGVGGVPVTRPVKVAGEISDARDYPTPPGGRDIRRGHRVVVYMTVGVDGRARDCRVVEPSPDPAADWRTCELAEQRFRFRPARNAAGQAVPAVFGWRQEWF